MLAAGGLNRSDSHDMLASVHGLRTLRAQKSSRVARPDRRCLLTHAAARRAAVDRAALWLGLHGGRRTVRQALVQPVGVAGAVPRRLAGRRAVPHSTVV